MPALVVLLGLVLSLAVLQALLFDLVPVRIPQVLSRTVAVALGVGLAYALDYSVFAGVDLRAEWMHPLMTGVVLVAFGEFVRTLLSSIAHRAGEPPVEAAPAPTSIRAA